MWQFKLDRNKLYEQTEDVDNNSSSTADTKETITMSDKMEFNMQRIGRNIAQYRKAQNMTQMNLADQMNISYQAVSNWERGQTMPDISKLPELALILGCSVDDLLGDGRAAEVVHHIVDNSEMSEPITAEELTAVAPALEPEQTKRIFEKQTESEGGHWKLRDLARLAPFLDEDVLSDYVRQAALDNISFGEISQLAPFVSEEVLGEISLRFIENGGEIGQVSGLAPFLASHDLGKIVQIQVKSGKPLNSIAGLAPFLDSEDLAAVVSLQLANGGKIDSIVALAPFLDEDDLHKIVKTALDQGQDIGNIMAIAPFLDRKTLQMILERRF